MATAPPPPLAGWLLQQDLQAALLDG